MSLDLARNRPFDNMISELYWYLSKINVFQLIVAYNSCLFRGNSMMNVLRFSNEE